uniref:Uncharacterized protein n=1 Tax=Pseudo-nitzschia australis TaxID=44445 RepID=A0A7S4ATU6_9STRA
MTEESLKIAHVPKSGRTLAFRFKLWLCGLPWVFGWLRDREIAKTVDEGAALLVRALLNDRIEPGDGHGHGDADNDETSDSKRRHSNNNNSTRRRRRRLRWDDVYPSGSFVGARSGTGGPLCEQSLLVYNATRGRVGLGENSKDNNERFSGTGNSKARDAGAAT